MIENKTGRCSFNMNGSPVELIFGMPAMERFIKAIAEGHVSTEENGQVFGDASIAIMLMCGYANHCVYHDKPIKYKTGDFLDFLLENEDNESVKAELDLVGECFKNSNAVIKYIDRIVKTADEQKKRMIEKLQQAGISGT